MKSVDTGTLGGRIRMSRQKSNINLKQMAEKVNVSPNYVSIIERNVKKPSDDLLIKIAALTDVSFTWLKNGDKPYTATPADRMSSPQLPNGIGSTTISLFLNIVLHESSTISKETITTILNIDAEVLDDILNESAKFDPAWEPGLLNLAQRLEIPNILNKLHGIESFLERAETQKIDFKIITALRDSLSEEFHDDFTYVGQNYYNPGNFVDIQKSNRNTDTPVREFIFQQAATHDEWKIRMYSEMHGSLLEELLFRTRYHPYRPRDNHIVSLVFSDENVFNELIDTYVRMPQFSADGGPTTVVLMLINPDSMRIVKTIRLDKLGCES